MDKITFPEIIIRLTKDISLEVLENRLRPSDVAKAEGTFWNDYSKHGFMSGSDKLIEVLLDDYNALQNNGKSYEEMAKLSSEILYYADLPHKDSSKPGNLISKIKNSFSRKNAAAIAPEYAKKMGCVHLHSFGFQSCPWGCEDRLDKFGYPTISGGCIQVYRRGKDGENDSVELTITQLTPHLIASHNFFQGNTIYRTDPEKLLEFVRK